MKRYRNSIHIEIMSKNLPAGEMKQTSFVYEDQDVLNIEDFIVFFIENMIISSRSTTRFSKALIALITAWCLMLKNTFTVLNFLNYLRLLRLYSVNVLYYHTQIVRRHGFSFCCGSKTHFYFSAKKSSRWRINMRKTKTKHTNELKQTVSNHNKHIWTEKTTPVFYDSCW